jgi:hypothetical protein
LKFFSFYLSHSRPLSYVVTIITKKKYLYNQVTHSYTDLCVSFGSLFFKRNYNFFIINNHQKSNHKRNFSFPSRSLSPNLYVKSFAFLFNKKYELLTKLVTKIFISMTTVGLLLNARLKYIYL